MTEEFKAKKLLSFYKRSLTASVLPFWLKYGMDSVHGGIYTGLDRDGSLLESDKSVWFQGRALWTFAQAYMTAASYGEEHPEYLDAYSKRRTLTFLFDATFSNSSLNFYAINLSARNSEHNVVAPWGHEPIKRTATII